jgi:hypothetical protein
MTRWTIATVVIAGLVYAASGSLAAADHPDLAGRWTLVRQLSQFPSDVGFGMDLAAGAGSRSDSGAGGRGSGGVGALPASAWFQESEDDARRRDQLVEEVRNPPVHLTIKQTDSAVTITDDRGRSRTFHTNSKEESQELDKVGVGTTARWDAFGLEIRYKVEQYRELRYAYSRRLDPPLLLVQVRFVESGGHDAITRVYTPTKADEPAEPARAATPEAAAGAKTAPPSAAGAPPNAPPPTVPGTPANAPPGGPPPPAGLPAAPSKGAPAPVVAKGPDGELKGLAQIGVVVEELSSQAAACGLSQASLQAAVSNSLTDAGLKVMRNSDEDTYVYVNINTSSVSPTLCVSRYDAFLYSYTTTTLPYQATPVLAQVELLHKSGLTAGPPAAHGEAVMRSVKQYADEFARRIRDVNQR